MSADHSLLVFKDFMGTVYRVDSALRAVSETLSGDGDDDRMQGFSVVLEGIAALLMREAHAHLEEAERGKDDE